MPRSHRDGMNELAKLPLGDPYEPHIAIDPNDASRVLVAATHPASGLGLGSDIWWWRTGDAGRTWANGRIVQPYLDGEGAADPLVGFGPDGAIVTVALVRDAAYISSRLQRDRAFDRFSSPSFDEHMAARNAPGSTIRPNKEGVCLARSEDGGQSWSGCLIPNSDRADKPAMAIDNHRGSPYRGRIYAAWVDLEGQCIALTRSIDGGRTAEPATSFGGRNGFPLVQLVVTPDGGVHMMWIYTFHLLSDPEDARAPFGLFYACSTDGGETFSDPAVVAEHAGPRRVPLLALAASASGSLLAAWSEADSTEVPRGSQARQRLRYVHTSDRQSWSPATSLTDIPDDVGQGLPAVASTADAWHVLSFDAGKDETVVRLYQSDHDELRFTPDRDLAAIPWGLQDVYLHGSYQVRFAQDIVNIGDYVGLAGSGSTLAAAVVLPADDVWPSERSVFASIATI